MRAAASGRAACQARSPPPVEGPLLARGRRLRQLLWGAQQKLDLLRCSCHAPPRSLRCRTFSSRVPMFKKLLIANRAEIARRINAVAQGMKISTVAIYSDAD